jgi:cytochrome c peroxidase
MCERGIRRLAAGWDAQHPTIFNAALSLPLTRVRPQFEQAYGHAPDRASLLDAVATYERSRMTPGSRFCELRL